MFKNIIIKQIGKQIIVESERCKEDNNYMEPIPMVSNFGSINSGALDVDGL